MTIAMSRMKDIQIDAPNLRAVVQPGVVNHDLSIAAAPYGLCHVPDPSSQKACTIGGNVAENAGGPHCLAYGVTINHTPGPMAKSSRRMRLSPNAFGLAGRSPVSMVSAWKSVTRYGCSSSTDLQVMAQPKSVFNPDNRLNPCKMLPATKACIEVSTRQLALMRKPLRIGARELELISGLAIP